MRAKSLILLVVALGCGMIAAVAVSKAVMDKGSDQTAEATVEIFVAVKDLPHAQRISAENVKLEKWPKSRVPEGALTKLEQIEEKYTNQNIFANEPILERKLSDSRESFSTGIPPGHRIFDIACNAGYIKPGDHVDIVGTFSLGRNLGTESRTVMHNVKVHGINGITTRDSDEAQGGRGTVFQLLVKESQLEALTLANSLGTLNLNLRPFNEDDDLASDTDNGESFLNWVHESEEPQEPAKPKRPPTFTHTLAGASPPRAKTTEKKHLTILTPNGAVRYEWTDDSELPQPVSGEAEKSDSGQITDTPANAWGTPSGNVYSGYGGYSPTYPTSTTPSQPADGASAPQSDADSVETPTAN